MLQLEAAAAASAAVCSWSDLLKLDFHLNGAAANAFGSKGLMTWQLLMSLDHLDDDADLSLPRSGC